MNDDSKNKRKGHRKELLGVVVSDSMDKTVIVEVRRHVKHPVYGKFLWKRKKFFAHDEENKAKAGDKVRLMESKPISSKKRWKLREIMGKQT
ncbi:MAG: 30S ribosomal protein S17 [Deltaproteobacteria bacterium RIFCSPHIGHO2_12_FULL_43_9]|nr:MAG: 30S ribosomal protein S17 [Deltaproteobacteria bacterium RIFCSPHIGHO2_12_FULL_43_9]